MKKTPLLIIGFTRYNGKGILVKTNLIIDCMTGNVLYGDAGTKLTDVEDALAAYLLVCGKKGRILNYKVLKAAARKALNAALQVLGIYISEKYPLNVANWNTTGYDVQTFDGVTHTPEIPKNLETKDGKYTGTTIVEFDKSQFAEYYEGRNWKEGDPIPKGMTATSKTQKMLFNEMTAGDTWNFQIRARGTKGASEWGQKVSVIVR
ncbi:MAG: hypothetical protein ABIN92_01950 [Ferruginibacter sp.]